MSHDPHAHTDQTVLDMIEHSPLGAVPHTPTFADALLRLYAAQKIYHDADHKDGHVTARSLAAKPSFHPTNLDALGAGQIAAPALESNLSIFSRYVASLPAPLQTRAETFRLKVAGKPIHHRKHHGELAPSIHDPLHAIFLVPGTGPNRGLPGNYLYGAIHEVSLAPEAWSVHLHDSDDGLATCDVATLADAVAKFHEVLDSAPFHLKELDALGFRLV